MSFVDFTMISIAIIEDDADIRETICRYIGKENNYTCEYAFDSVEKFLDALDEDNLPDIVLMDIGLPGMSGITGIKIVKDRYPDIDIIMLTVYNDTDKIFDSLCAGASGYLLKTTPLSEICDAIGDLYDGGSPMSPHIARKVVDFFHPKISGLPESPLTDREKEIIAGMVDGLSYKMIAHQLNISIETVRYHIKNIYRKLHVHSKAQVISKSLRGEI